MLARIGLDPQEALVCTMVLVAATDGGITDREIGVMSGLVQTLPAFNGFSSEQLDAAAEAAINLLREDDGLAHAGRLIRDALPPACVRPPTRWPAKSSPATASQPNPRCRCSNSCSASCRSTRSSPAPSNAPPEPATARWRD